MKQLPINRLLYLVSLACAGGIVLNIMGTVRPGLSWDPREVQICSVVKARLERGSDITYQFPDQ